MTASSTRAGFIEQGGEPQGHRTGGSRAELGETGPEKQRPPGGIGYRVRNRGHGQERPILGNARMPSGFSSTMIDGEFHIGSTSFQGMSTELWFQRPGYLR